MLDAVHELNDRDVPALVLVQVVEEVRRPPPTRPQARFERFYARAHSSRRLAWLTGFTGSAGFCIALLDRAGVFIDGRYRVQVKAQVALDHFTPVHWPETKPATWLREALPEGGRIGFDPWLYTPDQIDEITKGLTGSGIDLVPHDNLIDQIWEDRPAPPLGAIRAYPDALAGLTHGQKRATLGAELSSAGQEAAVITLPDSIAWLLNVRGGDVPGVANGRRRNVPVGLPLDRVEQAQPKP